jgi:glutamine amidotransferase
MCRFLGYLGPPVTLEALLLAPEHSLLRQAWAPRFQRHGTVNADGFGVGWYDLERRPEPAVYRSTRPMWGDRSFGSLAGLVSSKAVLAVLRDATPPTVAEESGTPPFADGRWLFAHNGAVDGWREGVGGALRRLLSDRRLGGLQGATDSEVLFALILDRLDAGDCPGAAMPSVIRTVADLARTTPARMEAETSTEVETSSDATSPPAASSTAPPFPEGSGQSDGSGGRMNMLLTDGIRMTATTWGDSLFVAPDGAMGAGSRIIASEPFDDDPGWQQVPDRSVVEAGPEGFHVVPMGKEPKQI